MTAGSCSASPGPLVSAASLVQATTSSSCAGSSRMACPDLRSSRSRTIPRCSQPRSGGTSTRNARGSILNSTGVDTTAGSPSIAASSLCSAASTTKRSPLPPPVRLELEHVRVVGGEHESALHRNAIDADAEWLALRQQDRQGAHTCKCSPTPAMSFASVHEAGVDPERDVVQEETLVRTADVDAPFGPTERLQRAARVVPVDPEVAGEVVARSERDADEGQVSFERDAGDRRQRSVSACHPERVRIGRAREPGRVLAVAEDVHRDSERLRLLRQVLGTGCPGARAWIDEEESGQ